MDLKDVPDRKRPLFPSGQKVTVALSAESWQKILLLRASGKDVSKFLRPFIDRALAGVKKAS